MSDSHVKAQLGHVKAVLAARDIEIARLRAENEKLREIDSVAPLVAEVDRLRAEVERLNASGNILRAKLLKLVEASVETRRRFGDIDRVCLLCGLADDHASDCPVPEVIVVLSYGAET